MLILPSTGYVTWSKLFNHLSLSFLINTNTYLLRFFRISIEKRNTYEDQCSAHKSQKDYFLNIIIVIIIKRDQSWVCLQHKDRFLGKKF
jgi:hypothetical protein